MQPYQWLVGFPGSSTRSLWGLPGSGIEPRSPALVGGFFTIGPPGKSPRPLFFNIKDSAGEKPWPLFTVALPTSFSPLLKSASSFAVEGLAYGSPWLWTLDCNSLLIPNKLFFFFGRNNQQSWRRQWHPTPVLLPGKSHGWRSLVGCSPWGREESNSNSTERLHFHFSLSCIEEGNGNPLQYSCLENPRHGGAWWAAVYGVAQSWTRMKRLSSSSNQQSICFRSSILLVMLKYFPIKLGHRGTTHGEFKEHGT